MTAAAARLLAPLAWLYGGAVLLRNRRYDRPGAALESGIPVISVGNITVGGTGKTPVVEWLLRRLLERGRRPAVVSRGYGGSAGKGPLLVSDGSGPRCEAETCGDEPRFLARAVPGALVVVGADRVAGARLALEHGADVAVLDDGFQHRRLARRLDLVLLDASDPFGGGRLLPAGRLREPLGGLRRADLILVTRDPDAATLAAVERRVRAAGAGAPLLAAGHRRAGFVDPRGAAAAAPAQALAFCGIGNPARFRADLEEAGIRLLDFVAFADHHRYARGELAGLERRARASGAVLVTTEKDLARLDEPLVAALDPSPLALRIEARIPQEPLLLDSVAAALAPGAGVP